MPLVYGSVCSGIEAATVAWHPLGWRPAFFAEIEAFPRAVLAHRWPGVPLHGDFTTIQEGDYEPIDLLVAGTPCQSFSVAGKRAGLDDARGNLTLEYLALARRLRPRWLVWENVPGVLSIDGGRTFGAILGLVGQLGYGWAWRILDAQHFGVPQRRRRVFLVGHLGNWRPAAAVLFEPESLRGDPAPRREAGEGIARPIAAGSRSSGGVRNDADTADNRIAVVGTISANGKAAGSATQQDAEGGLLIAHSLRADGFDASEDGTGRGTPLVAVPILESGKRTGASSTDSKAGDGSGDPGDPMFTLGADSRHAVAMHARQDSFEMGETSPPLDTDAGTVAVAFAQNSRDEVLEKDVADSLKSGGRKPGQSYPAIRDGMAVRRLTPRECERLQGFPDDYTLIPWRGRPAGRCPDGPRYKALGNSKAVPVVRRIGERIDLVDGILRERAA
jgi:DNA (cytosine-5)-methyltransferase 1